MKKYGLKKGQISSTEFLIVSVVLVVLFLFASNYWNIITFRFGEKSLRSSLELSAIDMSDMLIKNPGVPGSWESDVTKISSLGLAGSNHVLSEQKVLAFTSLDYLQAKRILGIPTYEYTFRIRTLNNTLLYQSGGNPANASQIIIATRFVLFKNDIMKMEFGVWI